MVSGRGFLKGPGVMVGVGFTDPQCFLCIPGPWGGGATSPCCPGLPGHDLDSGTNPDCLPELRWARAAAGAWAARMEGTMGVPGTPSEREGPGG